MINAPYWYMTTQEFADLVVQSLETTNHFKSDERAHPEDIVAAFVSHAEAIAIGAGAVGKKIRTTKNAVMQTENLRKDQEGAVDEYGSVEYNSLGYSEYRKRGYM